jgi:hypothetical protein
MSQSLTSLFSLNNCLLVVTNLRILVFLRIFFGNDINDASNLLVAVLMSCMLFSFESLI